MSDHVSNLHQPRDQSLMPSLSRPGAPSDVPSRNTPGGHGVHHHMAPHRMPPSMNQPLAPNMRHREHLPSHQSMNQYLAPNMEHPVKSSSEHHLPPPSQPEFQLPIPPMGGQGYRHMYQHMHQPLEMDSHMTSVQFDAKKGWPLLVCLYRLDESQIKIVNMVNNHVFLTKASFEQLHAKDRGLLDAIELKAIQNAGDWTEWGQECVESIEHRPEHGQRMVRYVEKDLEKAGIERVKDEKLLQKILPIEIFREFVELYTPGSWTDSSRTMIWTKFAMERTNLAPKSRENFGMIEWHKKSKDSHFQYERPV